MKSRCNDPERGHVIDDQCCIIEMCFQIELITCVALNSIFRETVCCIACICSGLDFQDTQLFMTMNVQYPKEKDLHFDKHQKKA